MSLEDFLPKSSNRASSRTTREPYKIVYDVVIYNGWAFDEWLNGPGRNFHNKAPQSNTARWGSFSTKRDTLSLTADSNIATYSIETLQENHIESIGRINRKVQQAVTSMEEFIETESTLSFYDIKLKYNDKVFWGEDARNFNFEVEMEDLMSKGRPAKTCSCTIYYVVRSSVNMKKKRRMRKEFSVLCINNGLGPSIARSTIDNVLKKTVGGCLSGADASCIPQNVSFLDIWTMIKAEKTQRDTEVNVMDVEMDPVTSIYSLVGLDTALIDAKKILLGSKINSNVHIEYSSSMGLGQAILNAISASVTTIIINMDDMSCTDCGLGLLIQLGAKIVGSGKPIRPGLNSIDDVTSIDLSGVPSKLKGVEIQVICNNSETLENREEIETAVMSSEYSKRTNPSIITDSVNRFMDILQNSSSIKFKSKAGAASGNFIAAALCSVGAELLQGTDILLGLTQPEELIAERRFVIFIEESIKYSEKCRQTMFRIASTCESVGIPCIAICREFDRNLLNKEDSLRLPSVITLSDCDDSKLKDEFETTLKSVLKLAHCCGLRAKYIPVGK